jgi:hypothetical protein
LVWIVNAEESLLICVPTASKDGSAAVSSGVGVNNGAYEIEYVTEELERLRRGISSVLHFPNSKMESPKTVMSIRSERSKNSIWVNILDRYPAFYNCRFCGSIVDKKISDIFPVQTYISQNEMRAMGGVKCGASDFGGFMRRLSETFGCSDGAQKISLLLGGNGAQPGGFLEQTASSIRQENRECGDHNSRDGADSSVVPIEEVSESERIRHIISGLMVIFGGLAAFAGAMAMMIWSRDVKPRSDADKRY